MKKSILIFCVVLTVFSLTTFGYMSWSGQEDLDLVYNVESRFMMTMTKEKLSKATSITDFLSEEEAARIVSYQSVRVTILDEDGRETDKSEIGNSAVLNAAQIKLLQSVDYSTHILVRADFQEKNQATGEVAQNYSTPHITIVPEKQAEYANGMPALIAYLRENSKEKTAIIQQDQLRPGRVCFTITREGKVANVTLTSTSGYSSVDEALLKLVRNIPGSWNPATNSTAEKVDQELVFFFGLQGC